MKNKSKIPECCKPHKGIKSGILSGILPHSGCIAIFLFAILGVTIANSFFIKLLANRYYLYIVFIVSLAIATIAAFFYIKRFEDKKISSHWRYFVVLYSSVIVINILMIYAVFPLTTNMLSGKAVSETNIILKMETLPCPGHAPLVVSELSKLDGVKSVRYLSGKNFEVYYDSGKITKQKILEHEICREFNAREE